MSLSVKQIQPFWSDQICWWFTIDLQFSLGSHVSSINKTDHHDIYMYISNKNPNQTNISRCRILSQWRVVLSLSLIYRSWNRTFYYMEVVLLYLYLTDLEHTRGSTQDKHLTVLKENAGNSSQPSVTSKSISEHTQEKDLISKYNYIILEEFIVIM